MNKTDGDFLDYLAKLEPETPAATKKEIHPAYLSIMKKAGLKPKATGAKKFGRVLLIAAAVAACATVTAAAYGVNIGNMFKGYFENGSSSENISRKTPNASGKPLDKKLNGNQINILNESGKAINQSVTDNGTTITLKAAVCDESNVYVLFDVTAPEGTKLTRNDYDFEEGCAHVDLSEVKHLNCSRSQKISVIKDENSNDNKKSFVLHSWYSGVDVRGKKMTLKLSNLSTVREGKAVNYYTHILDGTWKFKPVTLDSNIKSKEITVNKVTHFNYAGSVNSNAPEKERIEASKKNYNCTVKSVSISPFSAIVYFKGKDLKIKGDSFPTPRSLTVNFKDGTKLFVKRPNGGGSKGDDSDSTWLFDTPIDIDSVSSITLGGLTAPVS